MMLTYRLLKLQLKNYYQHMGQGIGEFEQKLRRKRITASGVGPIAKRKPTTKVASKVKQLLYSKFHGNRATDWGLLHVVT